MEQKQFKFDEATPLKKFIDKYRDKIVGHKLKALYVNELAYITARSSEGSVFIILDDFCVGIEYLFPRHATLF